MLLVSYFRGILFLENHDPYTFPKQTEITIYAVTASERCLFCVLATNPFLYFYHNDVYLAVSS